MNLRRTALPLTVGKWQSHSSFLFEKNELNLFRVSAFMKFSPTGFYFYHVLFGNIGRCVFFSAQQKEKSVNNPVQICLSLSWTVLNEKSLTIDGEFDVLLRANHLKQLKTIRCFQFLLDEITVQSVK